MAEEKRFPAPSADFDTFKTLLDEELSKIAEHAAESLKDNIGERLRARRQELLGVEARRYARWKKPFNLLSV